MARSGSDDGDGRSWINQDDVIDIGRRAGNFARKKLRWVVLVAVIALAAVTSFFQVGPDEVGVVVRFGRYVRTVNPGLHLKLPFDIERVDKVPVQRQLKQEFGFRTKKPGVRTQYTETPESKAEALMLTGDLNVATVEWIVQYKISDPYKYLFKVRNPEATFRDMAEASMRKVVGDHSVTEVLSIGRTQVQDEAKQDLQKMANRYGIGIEVLQLVLQDVNPPVPVRDSFNEVSRANQEREQLINQAQAQYNKVIPEARGKAQEQIQEAQGYAAERVNRAKGEVARFLDLEAQYVKAPKVTRERIYLETLGEVLPKARQRILVDGDLKGMVPLLNLGGGGGPAVTLGGGGSDSSGGGNGGTTSSTKGGAQ